MATVPVHSTTGRLTLSRKKGLAWSAAGVLLLASAVSIYTRSFCGFADYDDQGYVMVGIRSLLHGRPLYDETHAIYGPFFYLVQYAAHNLFQVALTHNAVRWTTGTFWLLSALLCGCLIHQQTRSWLATGFGFGFAMVFLGFLPLGAGHPQEICMALLLATVIVIFEFGENDTPMRRCLLGGLVGALVMTKINIGVFALLSVSLTLLKGQRSNWVQTACYAAASVAGIALPFVIMVPLLHFDWAARVSIYMALSLAAGLLVGWRCRIDSWVRPRLWITAGISCACVVFTTAAFFLTHGTTLRAMLDSTILQNGESVKNWYMVIKVPTELWPITALLLAGLWVTFPANSPLTPRLIVALNLFKGILALLGLVLRFRSHNNITLLALILPFCWMVLVPVSANAITSGRRQFQRVALCFFALFTALYPLPVAGDQVAFSTVLILPIVIIFIDDAVENLSAWDIFRKTEHVLKAVLVLALLAGYSEYLTASLKGYSQGTSLALPGAELIRTKAEDASEYQWITQQLKASCDSYFSMPGIFSLYFWTKTEPPTLGLSQHWMNTFSTVQQEEIVQDLSRIGRMCIVYNPRMVEFWRRGQDLNASPLARYIREQFTVSAVRGGYSILVRKEFTRNPQEHGALSGAPK